MLTNIKTNSIVAAIAKLSNVLEIKIVAEGIELEAEADKLRQYYCDYGQGYLFDKALPIDEFERKYMQAEKQS
jgi:EAL domain-containing protein (putative c-di-GMP-specific phosphodiesterase class I)